MESRLNESSYKFNSASLHMNIDPVRSHTAVRRPESESILPPPLWASHTTSSLESTARDLAERQRFHDSYAESSSNFEARKPVNLESSTSSLHSTVRHERRKNSYSHFPSVKSGVMCAENKKIYTPDILGNNAPPVNDDRASLSLLHQEASKNGSLGCLPPPNRRLRSRLRSVSLSVPPSNAHTKGPLTMSIYSFPSNLDDTEPPKIREAGRAVFPMSLSRPSTSPGKRGIQQNIYQKKNTSDVKLRTTGRLSGPPPSVRTSRLGSTPPNVRRAKQSPGNFMDTGSSNSSSNTRAAKVSASSNYYNARVADPQEVMERIGASEDSITLRKKVESAVGVAIDPLAPVVFLRDADITVTNHVRRTMMRLKTLAKPASKALLSNRAEDQRVEVDSAEDTNLQSDSDIANSVKAKDDHSSNIYSRFQIVSPPSLKRPSFYYRGTNRASAHEVPLSILTSHNVPIRSDKLRSNAENKRSSEALRKHQERLQSTPELHRQPSNSVSPCRSTVSTSRDSTVTPRLSPVRRSQTAAMTTPRGRSMTPLPQTPRVKRTEDASLPSTPVRAASAGRSRSQTPLSANRHGEPRPTTPVSRAMSQRQQTGRKYPPTPVSQTRSTKSNSRPTTPSTLRSRRTASENLSKQESEKQDGCLEVGETSGPLPTHEEGCEEEQEQGANVSDIEIPSDSKQLKSEAPLQSPWFDLSDHELKSLESVLSSEDQSHASTEHVYDQAVSSVRLWSIQLPKAIFCSTNSDSPDNHCIITIYACSKIYGLKSSEGDKSILGKESLKPVLQSYVSLSSLLTSDKENEKVQVPLSFPLRPSYVKANTKFLVFVSTLGADTPAPILNRRMFSSFNAHDLHRLTQGSAEEGSSLKLQLHSLHRIDSNADTTTSNYSSLLELTPFNFDNGCSRKSHVWQIAIVRNEILKTAASLEAALLSRLELIILLLVSQQPLEIPSNPENDASSACEESVQRGNDELQKHVQNVVDSLVQKAGRDRLWELVGLLRVVSHLPESHEIRGWLKTAVSQQSSPNERSCSVHYFVNYILMLNTNTH